LYISILKLHNFYQKLIEDKKYSLNEENNWGPYSEPEKDDIEKAKALCNE